MDELIKQRIAFPNMGGQQAVYRERRLNKRWEENSFSLLELRQLPSVLGHRVPGCWACVLKDSELQLLWSYKLHMAGCGT